MKRKFWGFFFGAICLRNRGLSRFPSPPNSVLHTVTAHKVQNVVLRMDALVEEAERDRLAAWTTGAGGGATLARRSTTEPIGIGAANSPHAAG